ncbi:transcriptional attenuator, LytR family [Streptomyces sp. TLI_053]|uniref:LCP family protein n=1 Tax=Streptomyces sp. TLI_053 TaxID=1855352 RepID=UPI00087DAF49|nr:LCP family protein [Streptomyces sp. TLI_053]SDT75185.1 transcriptional attenuator, LytR family [Streptomyces sp. TLI_053]
MEPEDEQSGEPAPRPVPSGLSLFEPASGAPGAEEGPADDAEDPPPDREPPARRRRTRRVLLWTLSALLVLVVGGCGALWWTAEHYASSVHRIPDAFPTAPESAQPKPVPGSGLNLLLVGLDARSDTPTTGSAAKAPAWQAGAARSDTMMLLHLSDDRSSATLVSLPRDSWVPVPGHGEAKLNAAYSWGGPALMTETVQNLTGIRIDHLAVIDWNGFRALTDAVGGVDITVPRTIEGVGEARAWEAGTHHMDGATALLYVRERYGLPGGDLDRTKRQQNFLRALMLKVMDSGTLTSPSRLGGLLGTVGEVVSVDDRLSNTDLFQLAWGLRSLRADSVRFMNAPFGGFATRGEQSVVLLADRPAAQLWEAIRNDRTDQYFQEHRAGDTLGTDVD